MAGGAVQPIAVSTCVAATLPNVSLSNTVSAPAKRVVPVTNCCVASSVTAVVSVSPGMSTINAETITVCNESGATKWAKAVASVVATSAAMASLAAARCGRVMLMSTIHPMISPSANATAMSSQPVPSSPATAAEASPNAPTSCARCPLVTGRSSERMASHAACTLSRSVITSSAIRSSCTSALRSTLPGSSRSTRVCCVPCSTSESESESSRPVGVDQTSAFTCSARAVARTAPSRRCDETPARCSRRASSVRKRTRALMSSSLRIAPAARRSSLIPRAPSARPSHHP